MLGRVLSSAGWIFGIGRDLADPRYGGDMLLLQFRGEHRLLAIRGEQQHDWPLGNLMEKPGEVGDANRMKHGEGVESSLFHRAPQAGHPLRVLGGWNLQVDHAVSVLYALRRPSAGEESDGFR